MLVYSRQFKKVTKRNSVQVGLVEYFFLEGTRGLAVFKKLEPVYTTTSNKHFQLTDSTYLDMHRYHSCGGNNTHCIQMESIDDVCLFLYFSSKYVIRLSHAD